MGVNIGWLTVATINAICFAHNIIVGKSIGIVIFNVVAFVLSAYCAVKGD